MTYIKYLSYTLVFTLALLTIGCKDKVKDTVTDASTSPDSPPSAPTVSVAAPLALKIYSIEDNQTYVTNHVFDQTATTTCTSSASTPVVTCTVHVPEERTWTSSFHFQFAWLASKCNLLHFQPYYYRRSTAGAYAPPETGSALDCSVATPPASCFNGAASVVVGGFPKNRFILYTPDETDLNQVLGATVDLPSAWSLDKLYNNLLVVNDMGTAAMGTTIDGATFDAHLATAVPDYFARVGSDRYMANSMVNYKFYCRDFYGDLQPYAIDLKFVETDMDSAPGVGPTQNHFATWKDLPP